MVETFNVVKLYESGRRRIVYRNLSLAMVRAICNDPAASSYTAPKPQGCAGDELQIERWHKEYKHWFYSFERA